MFYNYSTLPDVSADFTRDTYALLMNFAGLKLHSGYNSNSDAVLVGIIKSPEKLADTMKRGSSRVANDTVPNATGPGRQKFSVPGTTIATLYLQVIVIKKPTEEELALLKSGIGDQVKLTSRVIFNETIPLNSSYTREILDDAGTQVIATQNAGVQRKTVEGMSKQAAISVRDMILYAF
ncbi:MAG: hypothetical protein V4598_18630 [Bdellovibrionota bacterium]